MTDIENLKELYTSLDTLANSWTKNLYKNYKINISETYYEGEQTLFLIRILKDDDISFTDAYTICLQNQILTHNEFSKKDLECKTEKEFSFFFNKFISNLVSDYKPKKINKEEVLKRVNFDYDESLNSYDSSLSTHNSVRDMIDKYIKNKEIIKSVQLLDLWNDIEYFIETKDSFISYNWITSA